VLVSYPGKSPDKLTPQWKGPYIVTDIQGQTYRCKDLLSNKTIPFFVDRLKSYRDTNEVSPMDVALADKAEYYVDSVLDHFPKGSSIKKKYVLFRVRWSGSPLEEDTWEPYANVRECEALDSYIRANVQDHPELKSLYHR
jgi:hypothetical protein